MSDSVRLIVGLILTGLLAALAVPELSSQLPTGVAAAMAAAFAAVLHKMNAHAPPKEHEHCGEDCDKPSDK